MTAGNIIAGILTAMFFVCAPWSTIHAAERAVTPDQSIQEAINAATSGDTIVLENGVYDQQINIDKRVTITARNPGKATVTGAYNGDLAFTKEPGFADLYSVPVTWSVDWVMRDSLSLINYVTLNELKQFKLQNKKDLPNVVYYTVRADGFAYENGKLYIRFLDGSDPTGQVSITRSMSVFPGIAVNVSATGVVVDGLKFRLWKAYGIDVINSAQNVIIRNCHFEGVYRGIRGYNNPQGLTVTNNEFSLRPIYDIRRSDWAYDVWEVLYDSNLGGVFIRALANNVTVRNNYVHDSFDGIEIKGAAETPTDLLTDISYNVVQNIVDNPLEFDTAKRFMRARVHHNFLLDSYTWLSLAPFQAGFITVDHNIFYSSPERGYKNGRWFKPCYYKGSDETVKLRNMTLAHNTVVLGDGSNQSSDLYTPCNEGDHYETSIIENNIFRIRNATAWNNNGMTFSAKNLLTGTNANIAGISEINSPPGFVSLSSKVDFHLRSDSAAINAGINKDGTYFHGTQGSGTDLGAIEYGTTWTMPRTGPGWATSNNTLWRPIIPASLDPSWIGLSRVMVSENFTASASNFSNNGGTWSVSGGNYALANPVTTGTAPNLNTSVHNTTVNGDFTLTVDANAATPAIGWDDFSILFNYQNPNNYYFASFNTSNNGTTCGIFKVTNGTAQQLADITALIAAGITYKIKVERKGSVINVFRDNTQVATTLDSTWTNGKVGLGTKNNSATFDNLLVTVPETDYAQSILITQEFNTGSAANFSVDGGTWNVADGKYFLSSPITTGTRPNLNTAVHSTMVNGDFTLTVDATVPATSSEWDDFSVLFNYQDANNYYFLSLNESNNDTTSGIFKVVGGTATQLADIAEHISGDAVHSIKIEKSGSTIKAYRNGQWLAAATDTSFASGQVGLSTKNNAALFDNLVVQKGSGLDQERVLIDVDSYDINWLSHDGFNVTDWESNWVKEGTSTVSVFNGRLNISGLSAEATVWNRNKSLPADLIIRYRARAEAVTGNEANLNIFTHATEADGSSITYGRSGNYEDYHLIPNYIITFTGGINQWCRVRRNPDFNLLSETSDWVQSGVEYNLVVIIKAGHIRYYINGRKVHDVPSGSNPIHTIPLPDGQFAIRTWHTDAWWDDIEIGQIMQ